MAENDETASGANPVSLKVVRGEIAYARDVCECGGNWCQACTMTRSRLRWGYAEEHEGNVMRAPQSTLLRAIRENARAATERDEQRSRADKAEAERDAAVRLVRDLRDPSPCNHFDHHGYCQTHGWMQTDPPCPHARAATYLAERP